MKKSDLQMAYEYVIANACAGRFVSAFTALDYVEDLNKESAKRAQQKMIGTHEAVNHKEKSGEIS